MTVVIDCNIFVMCVTSRSQYHFIYKALVGGKFHIAVTTEILMEYEEIIQQKYNVATATAFMTLINELPNVHYLHPHYQWQLINKDPDDNKYCDCAVAGQAMYIITEDKHFDILKKISFPALTAIGIDKFSEIVKSL